MRRRKNFRLSTEKLEEYTRNVTPVYSAATGGAEDEKYSIVAANPGRNTCHFCGNNRHPSKYWPAREAF